MNSIPPSRRPAAAGGRLGGSRRTVFSVKQRFREEELRVMNNLLKKVGIDRADRSDQLHRRVDKVPGIEPISTHLRRWTVGKFVADVRIDPGNDLRIAVLVPEPPDSRSSLELNHDLPGNLRYATRGRETFLVADTQLDGATHLMRSFEEVRTGLLFALGETSRLIRGETLEPEAVSTAINACRWPDDYTVERDAGWEFRPRQQGDATPVQAVIDGESLRIYRTVLRDLDGPLCVDAICTEALRFNDRLRHARLAWSDGTIVAETRLHREQLARSWFETAARAVAVASRYTEHVLGILAESREAAELYSDIFFK